VHQLHHVDVAHRDRLVERLTAATIKERLLAVDRRSLALLKQDSFRLLLQLTLPLPIFLLPCHPALLRCL